MPQVQWGGSDCFTHMLIVGPTRCGKTATVIKPIIDQLLLMKKRGIPLGMSVVEPKGDVARMVFEKCRKLDMPCVHVDPEKSDSAVFNPMEGDMDDVAEATVVVLKSMFGKQEAFFATVQEVAARNITKLLKRLYEDDINLTDVVKTLRDPTMLEGEVQKLWQKEGESDLVQFFRSELLGAQRERYQQFVLGLRAQLENLTSNRYLERVISGRSSINIDRHFAEGGILAVNTAMGKLRKAGDAFGQFVVMHLQNGTFRRPGTEATRIPHFLIVDEYSRYINPDVELFLSIAAEYKTAGIFAIQSLGQLEVESGKINAKAMKQSIMTSCRNKIAFGGLSFQDALEFSREFGKKQIIRRESTFKQQMLIPNILPESYRDTEKEEDRIFPTQLMYGLPRFHYVALLLQGGTPQPPILAKGSFVRQERKLFNLRIKRPNKHKVEEHHEQLESPSSKLVFVTEDAPKEQMELLFPEKDEFE